MANDERVPRNTCAECGCPDQLAGLACGFCRAEVPMPKGALLASGALNREAIMAWKGMHVRRKNGHLMLIPPSFKQDGPWEPGVWQEATCGGHAPSVERHYDEQLGKPVSPAKDCSCGFYSGRTREHQMRLGYSRYTVEDPAVMVEIELAGKIYPASNGFRAQLARPQRIHVPHELWEVGRDLKATYESHGVEILMGTTIILPKDSTPDWCPKCGAKWQGRGTSCGFCSHELQG